MKLPFISLVVVNYNGEDIIKLCLSSLANIGYPKNKYEIIVVDNASTDESISVIKKFPKVKIILNKKNLGYSGINSALKYCKGDYILFLNNDIELDKDCIKNLVKTIEPDKDAAMAAPRLVNYYNKKLKSNGTWVSRAFYNGHIKANGNAVTEMPYLGVGLIRKDFVDMFGYLFDNDYFIYAEDLDLGLRIRLNGKKVLFEPKAVMYHMHAVTMQKAGKAFTTFLMERNLLTTFFKTLSIKNVVLYLPYVLLARLAAIIKDTLNFQFSIALARLKAIFFILLNFNVIMRKRNQTQKFRQVDDSYVFKVFSEKHLFMPKFIV